MTAGSECWKETKNTTSFYLGIKGRITRRLLLVNKITRFNVLMTVHGDISVQKEPTRCTIYFQFIAIINLYMFRAGLLLIIRR